MGFCMVLCDRKILYYGAGISLRLDGEKPAGIFGLNFIFFVLLFVPPEKK